MKSIFRFVVMFVSVGVITWLVSFAIEGLRSKPVPPETLAWAPELQQRYMDLGGVKVRYIKTGTGPDLVLFHTLRTQLDIYQKVIGDLRQNFTVYAVEYPGHGWSDIPKVDYTPAQFFRWSEAMLDELNVNDATLVGISIGGTIVLELAARQNKRVERVVSVNPYDYPQKINNGLTGSSFVSQVFFTATDIPFIGETFMRLRQPFVERMVFNGGVTTPAALSDTFFVELSAVGNRPGHYQAFINLLRAEDLWQEARKSYSKIMIPVLLVYGDQDWALAADRDVTRAAIPGVKSVVVKNGGHFLSLDQPRELVKHITNFAKGR